MSDNVALVLLAAGKGTRLKSSTPKPLLNVLGQAMIDYVIESAQGFAKSSAVELLSGVVVGYAKEEVKAHLDNHFSNLSFATQEQQLGTAHAVKCFFEQSLEATKFEYTLICCADTPLLTEQTISKIYTIARAQNAKAVAATFRAKNPSGYGRIVRHRRGFEIVEHKDCDNEQLTINEVNSGVYLVKTKYLLDMLGKVGNKNASGEFYLTDIFKQNEDVHPIMFENSDEFFGVNDYTQLSYVRSKMQERKNEALMKAGVDIIDPKNTYIDWGVQVDSDSCIEPFVSLKGKSKIASNVVIGQSSIIINSGIGSMTKVLPMSHIEDSNIQSKCSIGPFARIRPNTQIADEVKIGNFVETKKSQLSKGAKVSHLSYVGDARIGENTNIGCGFITCNYDGKNKHQTVIGSNCFIGSDVQIIAPVDIGNDCFVAAGSTITHSLKDGDFAVARSRQETKAGLAKKFIKK